MNRSFANILDQALARELAGQSREQVLQAFPGQAKRLQPLLETACILTCIQEVQLPEAHLLDDDRRLFVQAVNRLENPSVSPGLIDRINSWITSSIPFVGSRPRSTFQEKRKMSAVFVNLALMIALLLASAGGTLAAAAGSLPDSPLYPVKLAVEQVQVDLLADPEQIAAKHLELAQNRLQEILRLAKQGSPVQENSSLRLQEHFNFALQYAAQLGEAQMAGILTRAQHLLQNQLQEMEQVRSQLRVRQQDPLGKPLRILQQTQARVQAGLEDPLAFRQQARYGFSDTAGNPGCPQGDCLPNYHFHLRRGYPQLKSNRTRAGYIDPAPEDLSQPEDLIGEQECGTCLPIGEENHYGQDPSGQPGYGAGQPGGNPDPDCDDCIPSGDEHKYGQQPDQPGDGEPGGNPDCSQQECEAEGDQHQEGQPPDSDQGGGSGSSDQGSTGSGGNDSSGSGSEGSPGSGSDDSPGTGGEGSAGSGGGGSGGQGRP